MIRIRKASLLDYSDIWQVHASDIDQWVDSQGQVDLATFRQTSMAERWLKGGPWMSPETCAIHLNALLLAGQTPLVAARGARILGEIELFLGEDASFGGLSLNISVLYAHRSARGQGVGSALLNETIRRAKVFGCRAVSVYSPSPDAERLYRRVGLQEEYEQSMLTLPTSLLAKATESCLQPVDWPETYQPLSNLDLWVGSYQSGIQCWQQLLWALEPGLYALPLKPITKQMVLAADTPASGKAYLCLRPLGNGEQAQAYIWSESPDLNLVAAALAWAGRLGIRQLQLMCGLDIAAKLHHRFGGEIEPGHKRLALRLSSGNQGPNTQGRS